MAHLSAGMPNHGNPISPPPTPGVWAHGDKHHGGLLGGSPPKSHSSTSSRHSSPRLPKDFSTAPTQVDQDATGLGVQQPSRVSSPDQIRPPFPTPNGLPAFGKDFKVKDAFSDPPTGSHDTNPGGSRSRPYPHVRSFHDDSKVRAYPRLSKPVELMRNSYDVVVIGSGYGGGIAASRMARTGQSVCLLERGREKWPGEYPSGVRDSVSELHFSGSFAPGWSSGHGVEGGDPTGMYHLILGKGQNAVVCNGLGGTSLMNANVFMEADDATLKMKAWPAEIRENVEDFKTYYQKVADVLEPTEYPDDWPKLPKMEVLKKQAEHLGWSDKFMKVKQTTRFKNGPNSCGVEMAPSNLTGQDATGINDGSKTTTLVTYLADAWNWGAEMFCECEVRYIEKAKKRPGYIIYFAWHGRNRGHFKANLHGDLMWVYAKEAVFLGGGAIGTTEILLRSKAMGLQMSDLVGQNMSGNGDIFAFGYNTDEHVNSMGRQSPSTYNPVGPTITSVIDCREQDNPLDGFVIEEGAVPQALSHFLQMVLELMPGQIKPTDQTIYQRTQSAFARYGSRFLGPFLSKGALQKTQVYLVMSHDSNQATLTLKDDKPILEFMGVGRSEHVKKLNGYLAKATEAVGGTLVHNPFYALMGQEVTVHPIGGASMSRDNSGATGVTNHVGEVFTGNGSETHAGLIVTDAAVIPTALGANPFATISALAERSVQHYISSKGYKFDNQKNGILNLFAEPQHLPHRRRGRTFSKEEVHSLNGASDEIIRAEEVKASGFGFTEVMSGFIHHGENMTQDKRETYELAQRIAKSQCESARFFLSVQAFDTKAIVKHDHHRAMLTGTFVCPTIPGSPFMVQRGEFNLFVDDHKEPGTKNLAYDFDMRGIDGKKLHFHGYKVVDSSVALAPFQFWRATSTLYVTVTEHDKHMCLDPKDPDAWRRAKVVAKGIMRIQPVDFMSEALTLTPYGSGLLQKAVSAAKFMTFFTRKSLSLFLAPLTQLQYPSVTYHGYINDTPPTYSESIYASDGVCTRLHVWEPTSFPDNDPKNVRNLFMIPGAAVDHQIFALPTIPYNAVNYFTRAGYRVHITVHRIGQLMVAENMWTTYDACKDLKACLEWMRNKHGPEKIYTIAHCMGSVAFAAGLLSGIIPASWILGVSCSQVFMNPMWQTLNMIKAMAGPIPSDQLYTWMAGPWFSCSTSTDDTLVQKAINQLLRFYPDERREICNNASCHRCTLVFGRCWNHRNLNEATHRQIDRFFGGVNMRLLDLLMRQGSHGVVMSNGPSYEVLTTPQNIQKLKGIPFQLWYGQDSGVLSAESTAKTYELLCSAFGGSEEGGMSEGIDFKRKVVPGYGHLDGWMGRNAWKDIYPFIREEVDLVTRGAAYKFVEPDDKFKAMVDNGELLC